MSRAISRDSFDELKNYLGVYMQQGRVILDSDWNENQDIAGSLVRRLGREALGDGSPNHGFAIEPLIVPPDYSPESSSYPGLVQVLNLSGSVGFFLNVPGDTLDDFESLEGFALSSPQGKLRIVRDRPYEGHGFLRLSGHPGTVTITKTLAHPRDLSVYDLVTFRYRVNEQPSRAPKFFIEDAAGNRSEWEVKTPVSARDVWLPGFAWPLDIKFRILTDTLNIAKKDTSYNEYLFAAGGTDPLDWVISNDRLPHGLYLHSDPTGKEAAKIQGTPTEEGSFQFTVQVTDRDNRKVEKRLTLEVTTQSRVTRLSEFWPWWVRAMQTVAAPTGNPANLAAVTKYGFEVYQDPNTPLVWDLDDLRSGGSALQTTMGRNNFMIRGSEFSQFINFLTCYLSMYPFTGKPPLSEWLDAALQLAEPRVENAGRLYAAGLPCVQVQDVLYSQQADPNDLPLEAPAPGTMRKDTVYLDAWSEPVTYVEDPEIREVALGGPDTTTRMRVRHRVRVAQGGQIPSGNGIGAGTLATEGAYTAQANRLYLVEIDTPGDMGAATFRWSEDNASTIQRVIEPIPPGSTTIVVEDASGFHPGELILIRKEFGAEEHHISSVFGNVITLQSATGAQLAALPAASRVSGFTTFALADRPRIERWNAFKVPIAPDPQDATVSSAIALNDGVRVRFGGRATRKGDYWNFRTRFLAGDEASGLNPSPRIEQMDFARARGVVHYVVPLAILTRDGSSEDPNKIVLIDDRRKRVANAGTLYSDLPGDLEFYGGVTQRRHVGGFNLPPAAPDSKFVIFWSGDLLLQKQALAQSSQLLVEIVLYSDQMTDPISTTGVIHSNKISIPLYGKPSSVRVPVQLIFADWVQEAYMSTFLSVSPIPTSAQVFVSLNAYGEQAPIQVELHDTHATALELKKSY